MTPLQFAQQFCANYQPRGSCLGAWITDDGSMSFCRPLPKCVLPARCSYFEECVAPNAERVNGPTSLAMQAAVHSYQDCVLRGGSLQLQPASSSAVLVALTNNLLERCSVGIYRYYYSQNTPMAAHLYNNLFRGGSLSMSYHYGSGMQTWNVKDNLFDGATQSFDKDGYGESMVQRSHNGFITNTATIFGGTGSRTNLVADFQSGPLGRFYYPASGGSSSLTNLVNTGSRLASAAGLYHFTTTTNQVKEATSQVDISYHYVATVPGTTIPQDTDGDGIPDYLEDANGNGVVGSGETDWQSATDLGLRVRITEPKPHANLP